MVVAYIINKLIGTYVKKRDTDHSTLMNRLKGLEKLLSEFRADNDEFRAELFKEISYLKIQLATIKTEHDKDLEYLKISVNKLENKINKNSDDLGKVILKDS